MCRGGESYDSNVESAALISFASFMNESLKFLRVEKRPNWSRVLKDGDDEELIELARELNGERCEGVYYVYALLPDDNKWEERTVNGVVVQFGRDVATRLYRVETNDPLEIVRACNVGGHGNISYGIDPKAVWEQLAAIHSKNPIRPFFADEAGFQCEFDQPITDEFAAVLDQTITEGVEAYAEEDDGGIGEWVRRDGYLRLWWD